MENLTEFLPRIQASGAEKDRRERVRNYLQR